MLRQPSSARSRSLSLESIRSPRSPRGATSGSDFISVFARVRPSDQPSRNLELGQGCLCMVVPRASESQGCQADTDIYTYDFSDVFGPRVSQQQVFDRVARDLVLGALDGINCTIFAYGQTGSGKTFTMCGGDSNYMQDRGIIPRSLGVIFQAIDARDDDVHYGISMSMIEIYKEVGKDLLAKGAQNHSKSLTPVTVSLKGEQPVLIGARRVALASEEDGLQQYCLGEVNRRVAETSQNMVSSRSHCVCTIFIEASDPGAQVVRTSKVQIVDLAGSERLKPYEKGSQDNRGLMNEAVSINLSLHHLSVVTAALNNRSKVVPYRNSFLTKLLKDALGGNAKAAMVMTVDPSDASLPETISSCCFAQRVRNVKTHARVNEEKAPQLIIAELRRRNAELEAAVASGFVNTGEELEVSDDELRRRIRAFLEDDRGASEGGSTLKVGQMPHGAMAAFRLFREIFWTDLLRRSPEKETRSIDSLNSTTVFSNSSYEAPQSDFVRQSSGFSTGEPSMNDINVFGSMIGAPCKVCGAKRRPHSDVSTSASTTADDLRTVLLECQAECRMLRAALAAQMAPLPTRKSSSREAKLQSDLIASQGQCRRLQVALAALAKHPGRIKEAEKTNPKPKDLIKNPSGIKEAEKLNPRPRPKPAPKLKRSASMMPPPRMSRSPISGHVGLLTERRPISVRQHSALMRPASAATIATLQSDASSSRVGEPVASPRTNRTGTPHEFLGSAITVCHVTDTPHEFLGSAISSPSNATGFPSSPRSHPSNASPSHAADVFGSDSSSPSKGPQILPVTSSGSWDFWLQATTALTEEELAACGDESRAYNLFLKRDPRAGNIWLSKLQKLSLDTKARMDEASTLREGINRTREEMTSIHMALDNLKLKLREAEDAASVDASARQQAETWRRHVASEEPRLESLLREKSDSFQIDNGWLKAIQHELIHIEYAKEEHEMRVKAEFDHWWEAVQWRYPTEVASAIALSAASSAIIDVDPDDGIEASVGYQAEMAVMRSKGSLPHIPIGTTYATPAPKCGAGDEPRRSLDFSASNFAGSSIYSRGVETPSCSVEAPSRSGRAQVALLPRREQSPSRSASRPRASPRVWSMSLQRRPTSPRHHR